MNVNPEIQKEIITESTQIERENPLQTENSSPRNSFSQTNSGEKNFTFYQPTQLKSPTFFQSKAKESEVSGEEIRRNQTPESSNRCVNEGFILLTQNRNKILARSSSFSYLASSPSPALKKQIQSPFSRDSSIPILTPINLTVVHRKQRLKQLQQNKKSKLSNSNLNCSNKMESSNSRHKLSTEDCSMNKENEMEKINAHSPPTHSHTQTSPPSLHRTPPPTQTHTTSFSNPPPSHTHSTHLSPMHSTPPLPPSNTISNHKHNKHQTHNNKYTHSNTKPPYLHSTNHNVNFSSPNLHIHPSARPSTDTRVPLHDTHRTPPLHSPFILSHRHYSDSLSPSRTTTSNHNHNHQNPSLSFNNTPQFHNISPRKRILSNNQFKHHIVKLKEDINQRKRNQIARDDILSHIINSNLNFEEYIHEINSERLKEKEDEKTVEGDKSGNKYIKRLTITKINEENENETSELENELMTFEIPAGVLDDNLNLPSINLSSTESQKNKSGEIRKNSASSDPNRSGKRQKKREKQKNKNSSFYCCRSMSKCHIF